MSKYGSFMVRLTASADDLTRAMNEAREATDKVAVGFWRVMPWWSKIAHFIRHPVSAARLIRAAHKAGKNA